MSILDSEEKLIRDIDKSILDDLPIEEYPTFLQAWYDVLEEAWKEGKEIYLSYIKLYIEFKKPYEFIRLMHYNYPAFLITNIKDKHNEQILKMIDADEDSIWYMDRYLFENDNFNIMVDRAKQYPLIRDGYIKSLNEYNSQYQISTRFKTVKNRYNFIKDTIKRIYRDRNDTL